MLKIQLERASRFAILPFVFLVLNCGGSQTAPGGSPADPAYVVNSFQPPSEFVNRCATPRTGTDPATGSAYLDRPGSYVWEKFWIRSWINYYYLWYSEVVDVDPALSVNSPVAYFNLMKTTQTTPSGQPKDRFHFTIPTSTYFASSQSGLAVGYGIGWALRSTRPPRQLLVAFVQPNAPSTTVAANLPRGASVLEIDGVDLINANDQTSVDILNAGIFPKRSGESHTFVIQDTPLAVPRTVTLVSEVVPSQPVQNVLTYPQTGGGLVGYVLFNHHEARAESGMISAFNQLVSAGVTDLVLDLRYNSGGFLDIASEVAFMIAGPARTNNKIFELQKFNDKYPNTNPFFGGGPAVLGFHSRSVGFPGTPAGEPLPHLDLGRVYVLTSDDTCSASESIINGLRGVGVTVIQIGSTTCGKPYAFYPQDNCGTTYFSIQIEGVNDLGFGDYSDGFTPANSPTLASVSLPGCSVTDDFTKELGNPTEAMFAAALRYRANSTCPSATGVAMLMKRQNSGLAISKPAVMTNKFRRAVP